MSRPLEGAVVEPDRTRFPQAMVESCTEYDYADLPDELRVLLEAWCDAFRAWDQGQPERQAAATDRLALETPWPRAEWQRAIGLLGDDAAKLLPTLEQLVHAGARPTAAADGLLAAMHPRLRPWVKL